MENIDMSAILHARNGRSVVGYLHIPLFLVSISIASAAQDITLGAKLGVSIPNLTAGGGNKNPLNTGYSSRLGPEAALFVKYHLSKVFSIQPMLEYSSQGGKKSGLQAFPTPEAVSALFPGQPPDYLYARFKSEARLNYLLLPVLARFDWNVGHSRWAYYAGAGPFIGLLLSAHQVTKGESQFYLDAAGLQPLPAGTQSFDNEEDIKAQLHTVNLGLEGIIGLSYRLGLSWVFIEGGGNYGLLNIQKGSQNGKNNTGAGIVVLGYSRALGR